ncbi:dynamin family protein [Bacteroides caecigallinarum]|uniref:dynamin family protein n=1 Tax=Bacteroides caecigallinarum TaxID=1411144 RepID=UPI001958757F|nr:dynamin family protein [Bacteroides caecigallinarum]MBM6863585.1 dynamin family protein [Bacteroides caecigallinarum]
METIDILSEIVDYLSLKGVKNELNIIKARSLQENVNLILPLVGEFSSGKTTLINALTDSKKMETATKPTTATIYEVHFGCEKCSAEVLNENGDVQIIEDIADLKNEILADSFLVKVFDTSKKVPSTTILVDTPGLSSPNPKHKQTLVNFLPQSDGILLITDVNQQITRSLTDFIETMKLSMKPIYLVITKCDTKSKTDLESAKKYISENCNIPLKQITCVSSKNDDLSELYHLFSEIEIEKGNIIKQVDDRRLKDIIKNLLGRIDELLQVPSDDKELDMAIRKQEHELNVLNRDIDRLVSGVESDIQEKEREITRKFEDIVSVRLDSLVAGKSNNFDAEAISVINNTSSLLLEEYRNSIKNIFRDKIKNSNPSNEKLSVTSLSDLDLSSLSITGLEYNLNLNSLGHKYDGYISSGVKVVAAAATVAVAVSTAGTSALAAAATVDNVIDVADTVTDVSSIVSNKKTVNRIEKAANFIGKATDKYSCIEEYNQKAAQQVGNDKGIVESLVGFATEKLAGRPQRRRAISIYMNDTLIPTFKREINNVSNQVVAMVDEALHKSASDIIEEKKQALSQLQDELKSKKNDYFNRINQLRDYKNMLITM